MIKHVHIQNFKALRDVSLELTPMHLLIGPNDSGKTSILQALAVLCEFGGQGLLSQLPGMGDWYQRSWRGEGGVVISATVGDADGEYTITVSQGGVTGPRERLQQSLRRALFCQWIPDRLRLANAFSDSAVALKRSGFGLARVLDEILGRNRERFVQLEQRFLDFFPQFARIELRGEKGYVDNDVDGVEVVSGSAPGKGIYFNQKSGQTLSSKQVSDGVMLILAYVTVLHMTDPPSLLLVEEPENSIHPARLKEVLTMLRELVEEQDQTQVVLTTHSPYVVDLFQPEEVTLCQKSEVSGEVSVRRLSESELVRRQLDVFTLGEIWTSEDEGAIVNGTTEQEE